VKDVKKPIQTTIFDIKPKSCFNHVNIVEYLSIPTFKIDYKKNKINSIQ